MATFRPDVLRRVLFYGDSNTYGTDPAAPRGSGDRYAPDARWPDLLARELAGTWEVLTDARPGRCIPSLDFEWHEWEDCIRRSAPLDLLAVMLGTNDFLGAARPDAARVADRMDRFLARLLSTGTAWPTPGHILVIAPPGMDFGDDRCYGPFSTVSGVLSRALEGCARRVGADFLDALAWDLSISFDGIHLSPEGHRRFAAQMLQYMRTR